MLGLKADQSVEGREVYESKPIASRYYPFWLVMYRRQPHGFKTRLLGRGFHTLIRYVSFPSPTDVGSHNLPPLWAQCHGHARPGRVAHGRMPMTSQTLVMSFHSSVFPFVVLGHMTPKKYHV